MHSHKHHCITLCYDTLCCTAAYYTIWVYHIPMLRYPLRYHTTVCYALLYYTMLCWIFTILSYPVEYNTIRYNPTPYNTIITIIHTYIQTYIHADIQQTYKYTIHTIHIPYIPYIIHTIRTIHTIHTIHSVHTYVRTYVRTYIDKYIHTYIHTYIRTYVHTYVHTYVRTYVHTYIHTYTHIHMCCFVHGCKYVMSRPRGRSELPHGEEGAEDALHSFTWHTMLYYTAICTTYYTLYTIHYTVPWDIRYTVYCILYTLYSILHTIYYDILNTIYYTLSALSSICLFGSYSTSSSYVQVICVGVLHVYEYAHVYSYVGSILFRTTVVTEMPNMTPPGWIGQIPSMNDIDSPWRRPVGPKICQNGFWLPPPK